MISKVYLMVLITAAEAAFGQTQVDLKTQGKDIDFSLANSVRPFPTGTVAPATCNTGQVFFNTAAAAGANVYGCVSANSWSVEGGGGTGASSTNFVITRVSNTDVTIAPAAAGFTNLACGNVTVQPPTLTIHLGPGSAASGAMAWPYWDCMSAGWIVATNAAITQSAITLTNGTTGSSAATGFPIPGSSDVIFQIAALSAGSVADTWDASPIVDWQANQRAAFYVPGTNVTFTQNSNGSTAINASGGGGGGSGLSSFNGRSGSVIFLPSDLPAPTASTLGGIQAKDCSSVGLVQKINTDGSVTCAAGGGGGGGSYDPMDRTLFARDWMVSEGSYSSTLASGWGYNGTYCTSGSGPDAAFYNELAVQVAPGWWMSNGDGASCNVAATGLNIQLGGSTPRPTVIKASLYNADNHGDIYVGLLDLTNVYTTANFVGCRYLASASAWQAVILASGSVSGTVGTVSGATGAPGVHQVTITNSGGAAGTITCSVDGSAAATASGTIQALGMYYAWSPSIGVYQHGSSGASFVPYRFMIQSNFSGVSGIQP